MINNMVKKTARVIFEVIKKDIKRDDTVTPDKFKANIKACINNVLMISYKRAINGAQLFENLKESVSYISDYLKDQLKTLSGYPDMKWTYTTGENDNSSTVVIKIEYGLIGSPETFIIDCNVAFKSLKGKYNNGTAE